MVEFIIGVVVLAGLLGAGATAVKKLKRTDFDVGVSEVKRTDILYGYYGTFDNQVEETKDHVNLHWATALEGPDKMIEDILKAKLPTVLDVAPQLFVNKGRFDLVYHEQAEESLRNILNTLRDKGALQYVKYLVPVDEPNLTTNAQELEKAMVVVRKVLPDYEELKDVKLTVILSGIKPWINVDEFEVVGFDHYHHKAGIFFPVIGKYYSFKKILKPHHKVIIMPGAYEDQKIEPFVNFAHKNKEVLAIVPFLWGDTKDMDEQLYGLRSKPEELKQSYIKAAKELIGKQ